MILTRTLQVLIILLSFTLASSAQEMNHVPAEILLQLKPGIDVNTWHQNHTQKRLQVQSTYPCIQNIVAVFPDLNIWKIQFDATCTTESRLLQQMQRDPGVAVAQFNHYVELRGTKPNDPFFSQQWQWDNRGQNQGIRGLDIGLNQAWDFTTGGTTTNGDSIVVAIIDTGTDTTHADLRPNLWYNRQEVPNNGKDDDGNGFIDDYRGWNSLRFNDNIYETNQGGHGTGVAGVIGAKGNNGIGGTGVNWNVKLMTVVWGSSGNEEIILRSFSYVYAQRKLYNQTEGKKGAFVVAINASWGLPSLRAADYPIWCPFFDSLGTQGILTVNATSNRSINLDVVGDMPSACASEHLIVVSSLGNQGELLSAYGPNSVDLAAFGQEVLSTQFRSGYRAFSGTSFAAPQVAGAIALLYASPCGQLAELARNQPAEAALQARHLILDGVESIGSLQNSVVTGGFLRVDKSLKLLSTFCTPKTPQLLELMASPNPFREQLLVPIRSSSAINSAVLEVFNVQGQQLYATTLDIPAGFPMLMEIDAVNWPQGMYLLRLKWGEKEIRVQKIVKI